jgi:integrase/recombinase XerC
MYDFSPGFSDFSWYDGGPDGTATACMEATRMPTTHLPVPRQEVTGTLDRSSAAERLLESFLSGRKAETIKAYKADLQDFAAFLKVATIDQAASQVLRSGQGAANHVALNYKAHLLERKLTAATVNRRLAALRSMVKLARTLGMVPWTLEVEGMKSEPYRDTRGPGRGGFRSLLELLAGRIDAKAVRDRALLRCLFDLGLRRAEVVGLDLADVDLGDPAAGTIAVLGKGRTAKVILTLPVETKAALEAWLVVRGQEPGPLFRSKHRGHGQDRLTGAGLYYLVRELGKRAGLKTRPHGLRHAAITEALELTGGNIRAVQKFSRHRDVRILERYDDNRQDLAGDVARKVAASVPGDISQVAGAAKVE